MILFLRFPCSFSFGGWRRYIKHSGGWYFHLSFRCLKMWPKNCLSCLSFDPTSSWRAYLIKNLWVQTLGTYRVIFYRVSLGSHMGHRQSSELIKLEENTCGQRDARENASESQLFSVLLLRFLSQSLRLVMQNQSKCELISTLNSQHENWNLCEIKCR